MTWTQRFADVVKGLTSIALTALSIGTEAVKLAAEHLDAFVDDLNTKVS